MAAKDLGPLDWKIPIVNAAGQPTEEFQRRWATQRANNALIGGVTLGHGPPVGVPGDGAEYLDIDANPFVLYAGSAGTWHQVGPRAFIDLDDAPTTYAGSAVKLVRVNPGASGVEFAALSAVLDGLGAARGDVLYRGAAGWLALPPGAAGNVLATAGAGADPSWAALPTISALLDTISSTRGTVLYRGAAGWAALAPGTAGNVLTTAGAGADPSWAAGGGGGFTPSAEMFDVPEQSIHSGVSFAAGFFVGRSSIQPAKATLVAICFYCVTANATSQMTPAIYADAANIPGALLASGPTITGPPQGLNTLLLTTPLNVTAGQPLWLGFINTAAAVVVGQAVSGTPLVLWAQASNTPPSTAPAASFGGTALNSMWAKGTRT